MPRISILLGFAVMSLLPATSFAAASGKVTLTLQKTSFLVEVARTPAQRERGLMFRTRLPRHQGMLFIFEQARPYCFWMKNTSIPLTLAFLSDTGELIQVDSLQPRSLTPVCATQAVRYALEVNSGELPPPARGEPLVVSGLPR